ncbi:hypothetical protein FACS1894187_05730 [Synergistales bacterium]|nr:hypothetical protein FACS1894187_05730 [Synergistales bacterium]
MDTLNTTMSLSTQPTTIKDKILSAKRVFLDLCAEGTLYSVKSAINAGADVNARSKNGITALMFAAWKNPNPKVVALLLDNGANLNAKNRYDMTLLMWAARLNPNPEVIETILDYGADINAKNKDGKTAIMYAAEQNPNPDVVLSLLVHNADVTIKNAYDKKAIDYALKNRKLKKTEVFHRLLSATKQSRH